MNRQAVTEDAADHNRLHTIGHTISQRLRRLRKIPPELYPLGSSIDTSPLSAKVTKAHTCLGVVVGFAVCAAAYSMTRHLMTDKTIRLKRQNRAADQAAAAHGSEEHH